VCVCHRFYEPSSFEIVLWGQEWILPLLSKVARNRTHRAWNTNKQTNKQTNKMECQPSKMLMTTITMTTACVDNPYWGRCNRYIYQWTPTLLHSLLWFLGRLPIIMSRTITLCRSLVTVTLEKYRWICWLLFLNAAKNWVRIWIILKVKYNNVDDPRKKGYQAHENVVYMIMIG